MYTLLLVLLSFVTLDMAQSCHPLCAYPCNGSAVCPAVCSAVAKPLNCQVECGMGAYGPTQCATPTCTTVVPPDQCESDACPVGEIECGPLFCPGASNPELLNCSVVCPEPEFTWSCVPPNSTACPPPTNCTQPIACDPPACATPGTPPVDPVALSLSIVIPLVLVIIIAGGIYLVQSGNTYTVVS